MKNAKFIFSALNTFALVISCLFWLLSVLVKDTFGWFNFAYAVTIICGVWGISFILQGAILKETTITKGTRLLIGSVFLVIAILSLVWAISMPTELVLPIVCLCVALVLFASVFITGAKKWDTADNQKEGYKTYKERKEEESEN